MKTQQYILSALLSVALWTLAANEAKAQQDPMFTNYMFNTLSVNSGYAGTRDALTALLLHRSQWVGLDGAPTTQTLTLHAPVPAYNLGLGLSVVNDEIGPTKQTSVYGDIAYRIRTTKTTQLAFGLKSGFNVFSADLDQLNINDGGDQSFGSRIASKWSPNFGFSLYFFSDRYYVGASTPKLLENSLVEGMETEDTKERRHFFLIGGYVFDIHQDIKFRPSVLAKIVDGAPMSFDPSANFLFYEKLWAGAFLRPGDAFGFLTQYWVTNNLRVGYSYDYNTSALNQFNSGSHELMIGYDFLFKKGKVKSPRYF